MLNRRMKIHADTPRPRELYLNRPTFSQAAAQAPLGPKHQCRHLPKEKEKVMHSSTITYYNIRTGMDEPARDRFSIPM